MSPSADLSHRNFHLANGDLFLPDFGNAESDAAAQGLLREVFGDMEIVPGTFCDLLYIGRNIYCITQQEPVAGWTNEMEELGCVPTGTAHGSGNFETLRIHLKRCFEFVAA